MRRLVVWLSCLIVLTLVTGCARAVPPAPSRAETAAQPSATSSPIALTVTHMTLPTVEPTATTKPSPSPTPVPLATPIPNESGLTIEENEIVGEIEVEPIKFQPLHGSQVAVMARHAGEKQAPFSYHSVVDAQGSALVSGPYKAVERAQGALLNVEVTKRGEVLFRTSAGQISPITSLRRLWVQEDYWMLEIAFVTTLTSGNEVRSFPLGRIYQNGMLLNDQLGYEEMFGYQLLDGKPFYFYKKDGQIRVSYNNADLPIFYEEVPHHRCCSGAEVNPIQAGNWVGFFGKRGDTWYYTEIGKY